MIVKLNAMQDLTIAQVYVRTEATISKYLDAIRPTREEIEEGKGLTHSYDCPMNLMSALVYDGSDREAWGLVFKIIRDTGDIPKPVIRVEVLTSRKVTAWVEDSNLERSDEDLTRMAYELQRHVARELEK
jgi:hypothetical protein